MMGNLPLQIGDKDIQVEIKRKEMKVVRLKVHTDGHIILSAPYGVSDKWIEEYLESKTGWIEKQLLQLNKTAGYEALHTVKNGASIRILGRQIIVKVVPSKIYKVTLADKTLVLESPQYNDEESLMRQLERWWRKKGMGQYKQSLEKYYPIVEKHSVKRPKLAIRKMKTLWGSCSLKRGVITLNYYLYKAAPPHIDYVILHELSHFIYKNHSKDFYDFLTIHMPDWKERKRILDHEVVQGLG